MKCELCSADRWLQYSYLLVHRSQTALCPLPYHATINRLDKAVALLETMLKQGRDGQDFTLPHGTESASGIDPGNIPEKDAETILENSTAKPTTAGRDVSTTRTIVNTTPTTTDSQGCHNDRPLWDSRLPISRPDTISFSTVIDGCADERDAEQAIRLLERMRSECIGVMKGFDCKNTRKRSGGGGGGSKHATVLEHHAQSIRSNRRARIQGETLEEHVNEKARCEEEAGGQGELVGDGKEVLFPLDESRAQVQADDQRIVIRGDQQLPPPNAHCVTAAISACGRSGMPDKAVEILLETLASEEAWCFRKDGRESPRQSSRDIDNSAVKAKEIGQVERSKPEAGTIDGSKKKDTTTSAYGPAINAAMDACVKAGRHDQARAVAREASTRGFTLGIEAYNSLLMMASGWDQVSGAEAFFFSLLVFFFSLFCVGLQTDKQTERQIPRVGWTISMYACFFVCV